MLSTTQQQPRFLFEIKKTFFLALAHGLLSLILVFGLFEQSLFYFSSSSKKEVSPVIHHCVDELAGTDPFFGRRLKTTSQGNTINYYYDPEVEFLELGHSVSGNKTWNLYGPDRSGSYGGAQGIGGLEMLSEKGLNVYGALHNYFGDLIGKMTSGGVLNNGSVLGGYGPMPESSVNHDLIPEWRGHYLDATGFYYLGARYYDPVSGRFLSADPLGHDASLSLYDYCNGDPVNGLDPDGRCMEAAESYVPGNAAWQQAVESYNQGDYGSAALNFGAMVTEQVLTVATLGMGSTASIGTEMSSFFTAESAGGAELGETASQVANQTKTIQPYFPANNGFIGETEKQFLTKGQEINRYGGSGYSRFFSPVETPEAARALPPGSGGQPLRTFKVLKPFEVDKGTVAPAFGQPGFGEQFLSPIRLKTLLRRGILEEITP